MRELRFATLNLSRGAVAAGGLMSYGPDFNKIYDRPIAQQRCDAEAWRSMVDRAVPQLTHTETTRPDVRRSVEVMVLPAVHGPRELVGIPASDGHRRQRRPTQQAWRAASDEVVNYQDVYRLRYIRGCERIFIGLAQELGQQTSQENPRRTER